ncbi:hypothetical protein CHS0354_038390 [Potamilus streckersoni]|uniref:Uncharacterized protein n=1 Tax=Potamilus streckersoni TaxID=2493646 RepID=A0AAE0S640_9BIVA|nr:hypothetical protein CHS0354_038390 [Potamilus streckersoni]
MEFFNREYKEALNTTSGNLTANTIARQSNGGEKTLQDVFDRKILNHGDLKRTQGVVMRNADSEDLVKILLDNKCCSKRRCNAEQGNGEKNMALGEEPVKEETVAIIYMRDSSEYDRAVHIFEKMLNDLEVKAQTISCDSTKLINIIDFSETVCRSFKRFIIIISPDLYQLCHYFKHGDNAMYERILAKHYGQCLPVVLLNYLNQICFYGRENVPLYLVQFFDYGQLRCDYMNMFVSDHLVLSTRFKYCLYKLDDHEELHLDENTVMALVRHLNSPSIANGGNMDIRMKTDVECELKSCTEAIMAVLKNDVTQN